jgi:hypothetical protein
MTGSVRAVDRYGNHYLADGPDRVCLVLFRLRQDRFAIEILRQPGSTGCPERAWRNRPITTIEYQQAKPITTALPR